jgi:hemerythrin
MRCGSLSGHPATLIFIVNFATAADVSFTLHAKINDHGAKIIRTTVTASLKVGMPSIDREHQELFADLDRLVRNPEGLPEPEHVSEMFSRLNRQLINHFESEEIAIKKTAMPPDEIAEHIEAHSRIVENLLQMSQSLDGGKVFDRGIIVGSVISWVVDHLLEYDTNISQYVTAKRVVRDTETA